MNERRFAKPFLASLLLTFALAPAGHTQTSRSRAREELEAGTLMYNYGNYLEARQHFEAALKFQPSDRTIPLWIARAIHHLYRSGIKTSDNWATGMEAVAAYEKALPANATEALHASLDLLTDMGDEELADQWRLRIAHEFNIPPKERSAAYVSMAAKMLECARTIDVAVAPDQAITLADFGGVGLCIVNGLEYCERALALDPNNQVALEHQNSLQLEKERSERMLANRVLPKVRAVGVQWERGEGKGPARNAEAPGEDAADLRQIAIDKGISLRGIAIRKPLPIYSPEAREARVSGFVTVQVNVDEEGKVFSAWANMGHYLLRRAAVNAAQGAEFAPAYDLNGKPMKTGHTITYYFQLKESR